jgi:hypothetical protein
VIFTVKFVNAKLNVVICGMIKIDTRVKPELEQQIRRAAADEGRSFSGQIRYMLEQYFKAKQIMVSDVVDALKKQHHTYKN